jgi:tetratricopeptide (TPR) repeat protein
VAPRRDPPLSDNTWLVLPFDNSARVADAELIAGASVTLLTQELSRWQDVRVVPDDRVTDLLRQLPEAQRRSPGLDASLDMARRVGAGRIVIGSYLAVGSRANLTARAYDTRTGGQVRTVNDRVSAFSTDAGLDSLSAAFGRLGRAVLNVQVTRDRGGSVSVGTSSIAAYREYHQGMVSFNRRRFDSAAAQLRRAVTLDSTFAVAHVYLGVSLGSIGDTPGRTVAFNAARRFLDGLSPHMRLVIGYWTGTNPARCGIAEQLLRADSADVIGWMALGRCHMRAGMEPGPDGPRFVLNLNAAERAFTRALELDPGNVDAFGLLWGSMLPLPADPFGAQTGFAILGCAAALVDNACPYESGYWGVPHLVGDTVVVPAKRYADDPFWHPAVTRAATEARAIRANRQRAIAERFTAANPGQWFGHYALSYSLLLLDDFAGSEREINLSRDAAQIPLARRWFYRDKAEAAIRQERVAQAAAFIDSMFADPTASLQPVFQTVFGRFSRDRFALDTGARGAARAAVMTLFSGAVPPDVDVKLREHAFFRFANLPVLRAQSLREMLTLGTILGYHARRTGPALDTASNSALLRFQSFLALGDTISARRALAIYGRQVADLPTDVFEGGLVFAAESHLELGDTTAALGYVRSFASNFSKFKVNSNFTMLFGNTTGATGATRLYGRAWLLYADLCAARGMNDEARRGYRMVVGLWERGEPPVQPMVTRARAALAKLGV